MLKDFKLQFYLRQNNFFLFFVIFFLAIFSILTKNHTGVSTWGNTCHTLKWKEGINFSIDEINGSRSGERKRYDGIAMTGRPVAASVLSSYPAVQSPLAPSRATRSVLHHAYTARNQTTSRFFYEGTLLVLRHYIHILAARLFKAPSWKLAQFTKDIVK